MPKMDLSVCVKRMFRLDDAKNGIVPARSRLFCCFICGKKRTYLPGTTRGERKRRKIIAHALARARTAQIRGCHRDLPVLRLCAWFCQSGAEPKRAQSGSSTPVCPHARFPGKSPQFAFCAAGRRAAKCAIARACEGGENGSVQPCFNRTDGKKVQPSRMYWLSTVSRYSCLPEAFGVTPWMSAYASSSEKPTRPPMMSLPIPSV